MSRVRLAVLALAATTFLSSPSRADEGQWTPDQPAAFPPERLAELKARGLALSPDELWDGKGGGLLTAAVGLTGCTGAFVSAEGLLFTNYHCAFGAIQQASSPERNYLRDGFVARSRGEELPARGGAGTVHVLSRIADVTDRVRGPRSLFARAKTDLERFRAVERSRKEIVAECEKEPHTRCEVASFHDGAELRLQVQREILDVRLVYAPPRAVGEYGGEVDNWHWPRHTGDFAVLRAYVAKDGSTARFAKENVPYRPARFLPVSASGVAPGDLVMILGYPGRTRRYLSPGELRDLAQWLYPLRERTFTDLIDILTRATAGDEAAALKVSSAIKTYGNAQTNAKGQVEGLARNGAEGRAAAEQAALDAFLADPKAAGAETTVRTGPGVGAPGAREGVDAWRAARKDLDALLSRERRGRDRRFYLELLERTTGYLGSALRAARFAAERARPDLDRDDGFQQRDLDRAREREKDLTRTHVPAAQRKVVAYLVAHALTAPEDGVLLPSLEAAFGKGPSPSTVEGRLAEMDAATTLGDEAARLASLEADAAKLAASPDPYLKLAVGLNADLAAVRREQQELQGASLRVRAALHGARRAFRERAGRPIYPDANGTLRVSFASVQGYSAKDGLVNLPQTTGRGLIEKETGEDPFTTPEPVRKAILSSEAPVPVCFLSNGDTTGGNSGSPTVNGRGELVGLNFDRVWENVAGDFGWSPSVSRNVNVDIRYALFLIDRVDGVRNLLDELLPARR